MQLAQEYSQWQDFGIRGSPGSATDRPNILTNQGTSSL
jgi:hypothetical protein